MKKLLIVIPAYNEEEILEENIKKLHDFCRRNIKDFEWNIIISDNNSQDKTLQIAEKLSEKYKQIKYIHQNDRPKSLSLKNAFLKFNSDFYMYMDSDLSTDIKHIPEFLKQADKYDIIIGARKIQERSLKRTIISLGLRIILKIFFSANIKDFQCGFKLINKKTRDEIIPKMKALKHGFMDTEMLLVARKKGYKIKEIPVEWKDTRKSKVQVFQDILDTSKNILRIKKDMLLGKYN